MENSELPSRINQLKSSHTNKINPHSYSKSILKIPVAAPGAPSNIEVSGLGASGTNLTWDAPATNPGCVDVYEVCYRLDSDTATKCENVRPAELYIPVLSGDLGDRSLISNM